MVDNIFAARMRSLGVEEPDLDDNAGYQAAWDELGTTNGEDDTAKLLAIPISQEIAPDFQLIGSDGVIRRIEEVLSQRGRQRNVLLHGENGIGKSAIIHGLVQRKNRGDLSTHMYKRMFYRLNTSRLLHMDDVAEINRQFDQVLEEFDRYDVMVIENFHTLMTYLKAKGANVVLIGLLEALSRNRMQAIITCNTRERSLILADVPEIHEYFAPEKITEPNDTELLNILRGVHRSYEARYAVAIPDATLCTIANLTQRYRIGLEGWAQPGRALILLDRSIAQFSVQMNSKSEELRALEAEIAQINYEIQSITDNDSQLVHDARDRERCDHLQAKLAELQPTMTKLRDQWIATTAPIQTLQGEKHDLEQRLHGWITKRRHWQEMRNDNAALVAHNTDAGKVAENIAKIDLIIIGLRNAIRTKNDALAAINLSSERDHVVTSEHISKTFSELSGIPSDRLDEDERARVLQMEEIIGRRVFGQPQAVAQLANAVRRDRAGLSATEQTPKGTFLFLGPSGTGKTETAKALAEFLTGSDKNLIRLDMSEYKESHSVAKLIGAPPGYEGHAAGGRLTNAVMERPKSVIVLDEAEKAHIDIYQTFLQVFDGGRMTDGRGDTVDFRQTYIILTSNIGARHFLNDSLTFEQAEALARKEVEALFLPEFLGRLDGIICFSRLGLPMLVRVAQRRIEQLNQAIVAQELKLDMPSDDTERFCEKYQDARYGARPILKAMKLTLEHDLASAILEHANGAGVFNCTFDGTLAMSFVPA